MKEVHCCPQQHLSALQVNKQRGNLLKLYIQTEFTNYHFRTKEVHQTDQSLMMHFALEHCKLKFKNPLNNAFFTYNYKVEHQKISFAPNSFHRSISF